MSTAQLTPTSDGHFGGLVRAEVSGDHQAWRREAACPWTHAWPSSVSRRRWVSFTARDCRRFPTSLPPDVELEVYIELLHSHERKLLAPQVGRFAVDLTNQRPVSDFVCVKEAPCLGGYLAQAAVVGVRIDLPGSKQA